MKRKYRTEMLFNGAIEKVIAQAKHDGYPAFPDEGLSNSELLSLLKAVESKVNKTMAVPENLQRPLDKEMLEIQAFFATAIKCLWDEVQKR